MPPASTKSTIRPFVRSWALLSVTVVTLGLSLLGHVARPLSGHLLSAVGLGHLTPITIAWGGEVLAWWTGVCVSCFALIVGLQHFLLTHDVLFAMLSLRLLWSAVLDATSIVTCSILGNIASPQVVTTMWCIESIGRDLIYILSVRYAKRIPKISTRALASLMCGIVAVAIGVSYRFHAFFLLERDKAEVVLSAVTIASIICALVLSVFALINTYRLHQQRASHATFAVFLCSIALVCSQIVILFADMPGFSSNISSPMVATLTQFVGRTVLFVGMVMHFARQSRDVQRTRTALESVHQLVLTAQQSASSAHSEAETFHQERDALREKLSRAEALLHQAEAARATFISRVSHELRTPMSGVSGMAKMLMDTTLSEQQRDCVLTIDASASALHKVLSDVLDLAAIESGGIQLQSTLFNVRDVLEDAAAELAESLPDPLSIDILTFVQRDLPARVIGDPARLRQVLMNFASHSLQYTRKGHVLLSATVQSMQQGSSGSPQHSASATAAAGAQPVLSTGLSALAEKDGSPSGGSGGSGVGSPQPAASDPRIVHIHFAVTDTGVGMRRDELEHLFELPTRPAPGHSGLTPTAATSNIGISLASHLVRLMGGTVHVNTYPGAGSTFSFAVDLIRAPLMRGEVERRGSTGSSASADAKQLSSGADLPSLPPLHIAIVDSNPTSRRIMAALCTTWSLRVTQAEDAQSLLAATATDAARPDTPGSGLSPPGATPSDSIPSVSPAPRTADSTTATVSVRPPSATSSGAGSPVVAPASPLQISSVTDSLSIMRATAAGRRGSLSPFGVPPPQEVSAGDAVGLCAIIFSQTASAATTGEMLAQIRADPVLNSVQLLLLVPPGALGVQAAEAKKLGCAALMQKPPRAAQLHAVLAELLLRARESKFMNMHLSRVTRSPSPSPLRRASVAYGMDAVAAQQQQPSQQQQQQQQSQRLVPRGLSYTPQHASPIARQRSPSVSPSYAPMIHLAATAAGDGFALDSHAADGSGGIGSGVDGTHAAARPPPSPIHGSRRLGRSSSATAVVFARADVSSPVSPAASPLLVPGSQLSPQPPSHSHHHHHHHAAHPHSQPFSRLTVPSPRASPAPTPPPLLEELNVTIPHLPPMQLVHPPRQQQQGQQPQQDVQPQQSALMLSNAAAEVGQAVAAGGQASAPPTETAAADPLALGKQQQVRKQQHQQQQEQPQQPPSQSELPPPPASEADSTTSTLSSVLTAPPPPLSSGHTPVEHTVVVPPASPQPPHPAAPAVVSGSESLFPAVASSSPPVKELKAVTIKSPVVAPADMPRTLSSDLAQTDLPRPRARAMTVAGMRPPPVLQPHAQGDEPVSPLASPHGSPKNAPVTPHLIPSLNLTPAARPKPKPAPVHAHPLNIVLVEDNAINRRVAVAMLTRLGHAVSCAENGAEGVKQAKQKMPDAILMDCHMPVMDGFAATRAIRALELQEHRPRVPIIALTADAVAGTADLCFEVGMDAYLTKPFTASDLENALRKWTRPHTGSTPGSADHSGSHTPNTMPPDVAAAVAAVTAISGPSLPSAGAAGAGAAALNGGSVLESAPVLVPAPPAALAPLSSLPGAAAGVTYGPGAGGEPVATTTGPDGSAPKTVTEREV